MKKIYTLLILLSMALPSLVKAQNIVDVPEGIGTLNAAIAQDSSTAIYRLAAGKFYQLDGIIENNDWHLQIIGEEPVDDGMPATLQTNQTGEAVAFDRMFNAKGDITLKNIYFMNIDLTGQKGNWLLMNSKYGARTIVDNCIFEPTAQSIGLEIVGGNDKVYFTNNQCYNHGHQLNPNDGHFFVIGSSSSGEGVDTLLVENNTFVGMGTTMNMGFFTDYVHNFIWWNHNTWVNQKSQLDWTLFENEFYFTNNLMFNFQTQPWALPWAVPGGDIGYDLFGLIYADTIMIDSVTPEALPSNRVQYINYNMQYRPQGFYDLVTEINNLDDNDTINNVYLQPLIWPVDSTRSREVQMFADDAAFPNWTYEYDLNWHDIDPLFNEDEIYALADSFVLWTRPGTYIHALGFPSDDFPPAAQWPQWHWDPDGDPVANLVWPVFDGTYTDATLLKASIENLPLGDLNWYPDKKAMWEVDKDKIADHIKAGNTDRIGLTGVRDFADNGSSFSKLYPNPMTTSATIEFTLERSAEVDIAVYNPIGQRVKNILTEYRYAGTHTIKFDRGDLQYGVYFYTIRAGDKSESHKIIIAE